MNLFIGLFYRDQRKGAAKVTPEGDVCYNIEERRKIRGVLIGIIGARL